MLVEIMGHRAGWLTLGSGLAGGADVILIPEIPYDLEKVAKALKMRAGEGKPFSIVPVAEGAVSVEESIEIARLEKLRDEAESKKDRAQYKAQLEELTKLRYDRIFELGAKLEGLTGLETRMTILGHLQRGGTPSTVDRLRATQLGCEAARCVIRKRYGVMVALKNGATDLVPLEDVAGKRHVVTPDHPWVQDARKLGVSFGD